ncbi:MAG TPA: hypothetical protein DIT07_16035 [Sphingobacteriaceae bacterium]|nr:hypothetical protein [Sphingobacteriaceae bacterium]
MKVLILSIIVSAALLVSCNNNTQKSVQTDSLTQKPSEAANNKQNASANGIKPIIDSYIELKNALVQDKDKDAANAGEKMFKAFETFDKSSLTEERRNAYSDIEDDAKEHAEHIGKNAGNIKHQREHFATLSKDIYELAKLFGSGQPMYLDHCPMYDNNKGADWLSETKDIHNPYLGTAMPDCGTVKEELKL